MRIVEIALLIGLILCPKLAAAEQPSADLTTAAEQAAKARKLFEQGKYAEARALDQQVLAARRKLLGEEHPDTAASYARLALDLHALGKYAEAESLMQRVLAVRRKVLGEEHPDTA